MTADSFGQLVNTWSVSIRHMWGLPLQAHRYLIEQLGGIHAQVMLITRYVKFIQNMVKKSPKIAVQFMIQKILRNVSTVTGRNVRFIEDKIGCDITSVNPNILKQKLKFFDIREDDKWRVDLIKEIVNVKQNILEINNEDSFLTNEQLQDIINFVSTS